jgi:hypothetical protein
MTTEVLGKLSFLEVPDVNGNDVLLNAGGVPSFASGPTTNLPSSGIVGRIYIDTTALKILRDNGTSWDSISITSSSILGTANQINVSGTDPLNISLASNAIFPGSEGIVLPSGSTSSRPAVPTVGKIRYNTDLRRIEYYQPSVWVKSSGIIEKNVTNIKITSTAESDLMSLTIPGGTLGADGIIKISINASINNVSGAYRAYIIRVRYGSTIVYADTTANQATGTTVGLTGNLYLTANSSSSAQTLNGFIMIGSAGAVTTGITGDLSTSTILSNAIIDATSAVDSSVDQTLRVTIQPSGTGTTTTRRFYLVELL